MPEDAASQFKDAFTARTKAARKARGFTQEQMADLLGMPQDRYKQYEGRTPLPHFLISRFCLITGVDVEWMFTGRSAAAAAPQPRPARKVKAPRKQIRVA